MRVKPTPAWLAGTLLAVAAAALLLPQRYGALAQISLPFKLPQNLPASVQGFEQKATEEALGKILDNELPLKLDASTILPTVSVLPGGPFNPKPLALSAVDSKRPLPPGDYTVSALAFCTEYSVHQPGAGTAYVLAPLQGKAATAISTLLWRGSLEKQVDPRQLQAVSWAIQSGLTYAQMPKPYQAVIDSVIPEYKGELNGNFLQHLQDTYQTAAKATKLPPLEKILGGLGQPGQLALSAMRQQQVLLRQDTTDQLREQTLFRGQESGVYKPVKAEEGPWTVRIPNVAYVRFKVVGGNMASNNVLEIRILPSTSNPQRAARQARAGFLQVGYVAQVPPGYGRDSPPDVIAPTTDLFGLLFDTIGQAVGRGAQSLIALFTPSTSTPPYNPNNPCDLSKDQLYQANLAWQDDKCTCPPAKWTFCPATNTPAPRQVPLNTSYINVYPNMCLGRTVNGVLFQPQGLPSQCNQSNTHLYQFVRTLPLPGTKVSSGSYASGSCSGTGRNYGQWYLDACPNSSSDGHLNPETAVTVNGIAFNLWNDEPSGYDALGSPLQKQFYTYLMCGSQVMEAFTYTVKGTQPPTQQCTNQKGIQKGGQTYSDVSQVPLTDPTLKSATCDAMSNPETGSMGNLQVMTTIAKALSCSHVP